MTSATKDAGNEIDGLSQDRGYQSAMAHLQRGEWPEAIRELEQLLAQNPGSATLSTALEDARLRARFDANTKVKPKRFATRWKPMVLRAALVLGIVLGAWQVSAFAVRAIGPMLDASRQAAALSTLLASAQEYLEGGDWDNAERLYRQVLEWPSPPEEALTQAEAALAQISEERELEKLYREIVAIQEGGDCTTALQRFGELTVRRSNYKDVTVRMQSCSRTLQVAELFEVAKTHDSLGLFDSALDYYRQISALDANYEREYVTGRIVDLEFGMGAALLANPPISSEQLAAAQQRFSAVLKFDPRHPQASEELRLAKAYVDGKAAAARGRGTARCGCCNRPTTCGRSTWVGRCCRRCTLPISGWATSGRVARTVHWPTRCTAKLSNYRSPIALWPRRAWHSRPPA